MLFTTDNRAAVAARISAFDQRDPPQAAPDLKHAAVAIALVAAEHGSDLAFLLTRRAPRLRAHGGQWALPGGRCDPGETPTTTALREMQEEIGLALTVEHALGPLDPYPTRSGYLITPVVFWCGADCALEANPQEVEAIYRIPVADIMADSAVEFETIPESPRKVIRLRVLQDHNIHAPTAAMLYQFREVLAGRATRVFDLEQPVFAWR